MNGMQQFIWYAFDANLFWSPIKSLLWDKYKCSNNDLMSTLIKFLCMIYYDMHTHGTITLT